MEKMQMESGRDNYPHPAPPPSYYPHPQPHQDPPPQFHQGPPQFHQGPPQFHPGPPPQGPPVMVPVSTVTVVPGAVVTVSAMGSRPQTTVCRSCHSEIVTSVRYKSTTKTHLFALLLCVVGCWPCVCIPYCTDSCRNLDHYCPNCEAYIGSYAG